MAQPSISPPFIITGKSVPQYPIYCTRLPDVTEIGYDARKYHTIAAAATIQPPLFIPDSIELFNLIDSFYPTHCIPKKSPFKQ